MEIRYKWSLNVFVYERAKHKMSPKEKVYPFKLWKLNIFPEYSAKRKYELSILLFIPNFPYSIRIHREPAHHVTPRTHIVTNNFLHCINLNQFIPISKRFPFTSLLMMLIWINTFIHTFLIMFVCSKRGNKENLKSFLCFEIFTGFSFNPITKWNYGVMGSVANGKRNKIIIYK